MLKLLKTLKVKLIKKLIQSIEEDAFFVSDDILVLQKIATMQNNIVENRSVMVVDKRVKIHLETSKILYSDSYLIIKDPQENQGLINNNHFAILLKDEMTQEDPTCIQTQKHFLMKGYQKRNEGLLENRSVMVVDKRVNNSSRSDIKLNQNYKNFLPADSFEELQKFAFFEYYKNIYEHKIIHKQRIKKFLDHVEYSARDSILKQYIQDEYFIYRGFKIKFIDMRSMWILLHELLLLEEYFFETKIKKPLILDCGVNFGLALFYFKSLYPECRIIGFEPMPEVYNTAQDNIALNQLTDIELLPYALASKEKIEKFYISETDSMAGTLCDIDAKHTAVIEVQCKTLSSYLNQKVDFLKLDIEGAEEEVLKEAQKKLKNIHYLFCEYHYSIDSSNSLENILHILTQEGFVYQVDKSWGYKNKTSEKPFQYIGNKYSALIFAKNQHYYDEDHSQL